MATNQYHTECYCLQLCLEEECIINNLSNCTDVKRTIQILKDCGVKINSSKDSMLILGSHLLHSKKKRFFCGNSGTTASN